MFPSQVTRGERVSVTFNLRIFHVFRTKYRNTCKIYKKQLNKAYYEYINNLIETVQISLGNFGDLGNLKDKIK